MAVETKNDGVDPKAAVLALLGIIERKSKNNEKRRARVRKIIGAVNSVN